MLVNREMKPGDILSVQLPSESEKGAITVLGCVVHVKLEGENIWSVGLTFARELNPRDLAPFGSFDDKTADQRNRPRYKCETEANYQLVTTTDEKQHPAKVLNISSTGIGLMVDQMVPTGTLLSVEMHANDPETARTILSCVVHLSPQQENQWALGCNFITELSEKDLSVFV